MTTDVVKDGAFAWIVCAMSFLSQVVHGGLVFSMGMFFIMFRKGLDGGDGVITFITSLNYSVCFAVCPLVGLLTTRFGERKLALSGSLIATAGLACSALSTQVFHLYLVYGLLAGVGMGLAYNPSISILAKHFDRHKKIAIGLAVCGVGVGSFIFPPIIQALEDAFGWRGALIMTAGIQAQNLIMATFFRAPEEVKLGYRQQRVARAGTGTARDATLPGDGRLVPGDLYGGGSMGGGRLVPGNLYGGELAGGGRLVPGDLYGGGSMGGGRLVPGNLYGGELVGGGRLVPGNLYGGELAAGGQLVPGDLYGGGSPGGGRLVPDDLYGGGLAASERMVVEDGVNARLPAEKQCFSSALIYHCAPCDILGHKGPVHQFDALEHKGPVHQLDMLEHKEPVQQLDALEHKGPTHRFDALEHKGPVHQFDALEHKGPVHQLDNAAAAEEAETEADAAALACKAELALSADSQKDCYYTSKSSLFQNVPFISLCLHSMTIQFPIAIVYTHLGNYALSVDFTDADVVLVYMVMGVVMTVTRVLMGVLAEVTYAKPAVLVIPCAFVNGAATILLPFTRSLALMFAYAALMPMLLAPYTILIMNMESVPVSLVPTAYGIVCFVRVPAIAFGAPIAAWLFEITQIYASSFYLAGGLFLMAGIVMVPQAFGQEASAK